MRSLRGELKETAIRTCTVQCGSVNTEFASVVAGASVPFVHDVGEWAFRPLEAADVAQVVRWVVMTPSHIEIPEIVVRPRGDRSLL
jgi:NADP-dependent 3-hydroxy acid dehydrogenase YdfG